MGQFAQALVGATPPRATAQWAQHSRGFAVAEQRMQRFALERGSNAVAIGSERSKTGRAMLLANPHFPWVGGMRFYEMQLTIPGKLDVMGAALPGLPLINIGFNQHVAWTHTVDTSKHFTLYRLALDPHDPTRYLLDGNFTRCKSTPSALRSNRPMAASSLSRGLFTVQCSGRLCNGRASWTGTIMWPLACVMRTSATIAYCSSGTR